MNDIEHIKQDVRAELDSIDNTNLILQIKWYLSANYGYPEDKIFNDNIPANDLVAGTDVILGRTVRHKQYTEFMNFQIID